MQSHQGAPDSVEQRAVMQGFLEHFAEACPSRALSHLPAEKTGHEDCRKPNVAAPQPIDQLEAIHPGHCIIDEEAATGRKIVVEKKALRIAIDADVEPLDLEGEFQRAQDGRIIVDDDHRSGGFQRRKVLNRHASRYRARQALRKFRETP